MMGVGRFPRAQLSPPCAPVSSCAPDSGPRVPRADPTLRRAPPPTAARLPAPGLRVVASKQPVCAVCARLSRAPNLSAESLRVPGQVGVRVRAQELSFRGWKIAWVRFFGLLQDRWVGIIDRVSGVGSEPSRHSDMPCNNRPISGITPTTSPSRGS